LSEFSALDGIDRFALSRAFAAGRHG